MLNRAWAAMIVGKPSRIRKPVRFSVTSNEVVKKTSVARAMTISGMITLT